MKNFIDNFLFYSRNNFSFFKGIFLPIKKCNADGVVKKTKKEFGIKD
jgi:hypothetical protein